MKPDSPKRLQLSFRFTVIIALTLLCIPKASFSQLFWIESFSTTCTGFSTTCTVSYFNANNPSPNGAWTQTAIGVQGSKADVWFISDAENGNAVGSCGSSSGGNGTLHIANIPCGLCFPCPTGDCAAEYNAGGFGSNTKTDNRVESPVIDCSGKSNITLSFKWIGKGQFSGGTYKDYCDVVYSSNGGSSWSVLQHGFTGLTCGSRGKWACLQKVLPSSADNNSNVKIGFEWINNNDGSGSDPSFAVDEVMLSVNGTIDASCNFLLPIELISFRGILVDKTVQLNWLTASEINNNYFLIERSDDALHYDSIGVVPGAGNSTTENSYSYFDASPNAGTNYYRLRQVDYTGSFSFSNAIAIKVMNEAATTTFQVFSNPCPHGKEVTLGFTLLQPGEVHWMVQDLEGTVHSQSAASLTEGFHSLQIATDKMAAGCYIVGFSAGDSPLKFSKLIVY